MKRTLLMTAFVAFTTPVAALAIDMSAAVKAYMDTSVQPWASEQMIIDAINAQNAATAGYDAAQIEALDQAWRTEVGAGSTPTIDPVLMNGTSQWLRSQVELMGGAVTEVFVMDMHGLNVAASDVTSDYWQGDEAKYQQTYLVGPGAVHMSEIEFDESSQSYQAQVSIAITDPATGKVIGAMTVGINADALM